jgi:hypothetical protein
VFLKKVFFRPVKKAQNSTSKRLAGFIRGKTCNALSQARLVGGIAADENLLDATGLARADFDRGPGDSQAAGQELDAHRVGRTFDRRRGEFHLEGVAKQAHDHVPGGARLDADFKRQARRVVLDGEHKKGARRKAQGKKRPSRTQQPNKPNKPNKLNKPNKPN